MLFPSFEIVIKADLIKPVCIIEVLREKLTGSRYSAVPCKRLTRSRREFWGSRGRRDTSLLPRTLTRRRLPVCPDAAWRHIGNNYAYVSGLCAFAIVQVCTCLFKLWLGLQRLCIPFSSLVFSGQQCEPSPHCTSDMSLMFCGIDLFIYFYFWSVVVFFSLRSISWIIDRCLFPIS